MNMPFQKITAETDFVSAAKPPKQTFEQSVEGMAEYHRDRIKRVTKLREQHSEVSAEAGKRIDNSKRVIDLCDRDIAGSRAYLVELEKAR